MSKSGQRQIFRVQNEYLTTITAVLLLSTIRGKARGSPGLCVTGFENLLPVHECDGQWDDRVTSGVRRQTLVVVPRGKAAMPLHYGGVFGTSLTRRQLGESREVSSRYLAKYYPCRGWFRENNLAWEMLSKDSAEIVNSTSSTICSLK